MKLRKKVGRQMVSWNGYISYIKVLSICLDVMKKTTKNLSQDTRSPDRYLNPGPSEYEAETLNP
jgi:hypothetical protein